MFTTQFIVALVLAGCVAVALPYYSKITFRGKNTKTLIYKMCLSATFVISSILASKSFETIPKFMYIMLAGFAASFIGDFFLGKSEGNKFFVIGSSFFAASHVLYIVGLSSAAAYLTPAVHWFNGLEIGIYLAICSVMALVFIWKLPKYSKLLIPMVIYLFIIGLMVTKAWGLSYRLLLNGTTKAVLLLPVGALFFILSDYTLGMMRFRMHKKTMPFKTFCTCSYFVAQTLLALSMFVLIRL